MPLSVALSRHALANHLAGGHIGVTANNVVVPWQSVIMRHGAAAAMRRAGYASWRGDQRTPDLHGVVPRKLWHWFLAAAPKRRFSRRRGRFADLSGWVLRFNAKGPAGLVDDKAPGLVPRPERAQRRELAQLVEDGPILGVHGVVRWRLSDLAASVMEKYRTSISEQTLSRNRSLGSQNYEHHHSCTTSGARPRPVVQASSEWRAAPCAEASVR